MKDIKNIIKCNNISEKDINHIYSIILRAWYEKNQMVKYNKIQKFTLQQMKDFEITFTGQNFILLLRNNKIIKNEQELNKIVNIIYTYFDKKYPINYNYHLIDPIYFSLFFYDLLDKIERVNYDSINIKDIKLLRKNSIPVSIEDSERYKALIINNYKMYSPFKSNLIIHTPEQRLLNVYNSVMENGYGYNEQYAIFYNDEPFLRDGQHRIASLKYIYGNIDVKIVRFYLKDNYFYD